MASGVSKGRNASICRGEAVREEGMCTVQFQTVSSGSDLIAIPLFDVSNITYIYMYAHSGYSLYWCPELETTEQRSLYLMKEADTFPETLCLKKPTTISTVGQVYCSTPSLQTPVHVCSCCVGCWHWK